MKKENWNENENAMKELKTENKIKSEKEKMWKLK